MNVVVLIVWDNARAHLRPLQDTLQTEDMLAALQRGHGLFAKGTQTDGALI